MRDKVTFTRTLIDQLPVDQQIPLEHAMSLWWYNIRANGGMRLTAEGHQVLGTVLEVEHYTVTVDPKKFSRRLLLALDRKLRYPYYIQSSKGLARGLIMYGSQEAVLANLYGDLDRFMQNYA